jgi:hypothetical protein
VEDPTLGQIKLVAEAAKEPPQPGHNLIKRSSSALTVGDNKLECLLLPSLFTVV